MDWCLRLIGAGRDENAFLRLEELMACTRWVSLAALMVFSIFWSASAVDKEIHQGAKSSTKPALSPHQQLAREIFKELIEINTTDSIGSTTQAAEAMAARLRAAGFAEADVRVLGPHPRKGNLVARLRGKGIGKPILLLAHLDVVEARREDWSFDPFKFIEHDDYFYGRGTNDIKSGAALLVANLIRLKQEGFVPNQDLILALTGDEEGGSYNGVDWLLKNHRQLIDADYCLNTDGGGGEMKNGKYLANDVQAGEKIYLSFSLEVKNRGGHSSLPVKDNAIYHLAEGLSRLAQFDFPVRLNEITRSYFERMSKVQNSPLAADMEAVTQSPADPAVVSGLAQSPYFNALMRTTCVATMLQAGHAENALPQTARAIVNCRLLPEDSPEEVQRILKAVVADDKIVISPIGIARPSPASPLRPSIMQAIEHTTAELWPGVPVIPVMSTGATDGLRLRRAGIPTYGVSGLFDDIDDVRAHGKDERIGVKQFFDGLEFMHRLVKALSLPS
jgi:acetylornithine deacetylase/succinyl-diaminopimelate desuccinylase-like protein